MRTGIPKDEREYYKKLSIFSVFGEDKGLSGIVEKLYSSNIDFYYKLESKSEKDFWSIVGRTTERNKEKIRRILQIFPPDFGQTMH